MANLPISQLPNLKKTGVTTDDLLVIVNYKDETTGVTKNIKVGDMVDYIGCCDTDGVPYSGPNIDCLDIQSGDSLTDVIVTIGNVFCSPLPPNLQCNNINLPDANLGNCEDPIQSMLNFSITEFCQANPVKICTSNVNPMEYLFQIPIDDWIAEQKTCPSDGNPMDYFLGIPVNDWIAENKVCTSNVNAFDKLVSVVIDTYYYDNKVCTSNVNAMNYLIDNAITKWENIP